MSEDGYKRGSEWRKWDLHVHTPKTFLNDQFSGASVDEFVKKISNSGVVAVGLTNYFRFDDLELGEIKEKLNNNGIIVFPNIEFRTQPQNKDNEEMHIHILFSNTLSTEKITNFLGRLKTVDDKYCKDLKKSEIKTTLITFDMLREQLAEDKDIKYLEDYLIVACPRGQGSFRPSKAKDGRGGTFAVIVDQYSDILFGNVDDIEFFLKNDRYENAQAKPVFSCSDAHKLGDIGTKYTWVKADVTFEGLKQTLYEPKERIKIQKLKPEDDMIDSLIIDSIQYDEQKTFFNQGLNCLIGIRGSGKSNLLKNIVFLSDKEEYEENRGLKNSDLKKLDDFQVIWRDGVIDKNDANKHRKKILFIPQKYLGNKVYESHNENVEALEDFVNRLLNSNKTFSEAKDRIELTKTDFKKKINGFIEDLISLDVQISVKEKDIKELPKSEDIKKSIEKLEADFNKVKASIKINAQELKDHKELSQKVIKLKLSIEKTQKDINSYNSLIEYNIFDADVILDKFEFSEHEEEKIESEINIKNKDFSVSFIKKRVKELSKAKSKLEKDYKSITEQIKPINEKIKENQELKKKAEKIDYENEKLQKINELNKDVKKLKENIADRKKGILNVYKSLIESILVEIGKVKIGDTEKIEIKITPSLNKDLYFEALMSIKKDGIKSLFGFEKIDDLKKKIEIGNVYNFTSKIFEGIFNGSLILKSNNNLKDFLLHLFNFEYHIDYLECIKHKDGTLFKNMSAGQKMITLLTLIFSFDENRYPILIDQPEDDLDSTTIAEQVAKFIKKQKQERQIIIATHNASLVICSDAENIIVANNKSGKFTYETGAIENPARNSNIVEILEGGEEAFRKRREKYQFKNHKS